MSINQRLYNQVMMLDNFTCVYCGKRTADVGIDHLIPQIKGGPDVLENLVAACPSCNSSKRDRGLHLLSRLPTYGRFERQQRRTLKSIRPAVKIDRDPRSIEELAALRNERGEYTYSKSQVARMVGGRRQSVWARIKELRAE